MGEPAQDIDPQRAFAGAVHGVVLRLRRLGERRLALEPIPLSEVDVLMQVHEHPGCSVTQIAQTLTLAPSNVSTTVGQLVARGLLERRPDPADGRRHLLYSTPGAELDRARIDEAWARVITEFLEGLPADQRAAALAATEPLRRLAELRLDPPPQPCDG
ncbi:MAG: MarR family winged helix-turn-helix transcriptional regulator [Actinobacteria bacterium]|nr:MarR family winged helix-turn-helix transcriptional regulator [Actinomycetota bacterium]